MKNKFYIMTALVISLTGCSNIEDGTQPTGNFPEDHVIRIVTEVNAPVSRAGYDASNLESFGLIIHNSENIAYDYNSQMVKSNNDWNTADGQQMLWDNARVQCIRTARRDLSLSIHLLPPRPEWSWI